MNLPKALRDLRIDIGISQVEAARLIGCSQTYLSQLEKGQRNPTVHFLEEVAHGYRISVPMIFFVASSKEEIPVDMRKILISELLNEI